MCLATMNERRLSGKLLGRRYVFGVAQKVGRRVPLERASAWTISRTAGRAASTKPRWSALRRVHRAPRASRRNIGSAGGDVLDHGQIRRQLRGQREDLNRAGSAR